jgi:hypothetical protein
MTTQPTAQLDQDRLTALVLRAVDEVGATLNAALVVLGDKLGYYRALSELGAITPSSSRSTLRPGCRKPGSGSTPRSPEASSTSTLRQLATRCPSSTPGTDR